MKIAYNLLCILVAAGLLAGIYSLHSFSNDKKYEVSSIRVVSGQSNPVLSRPNNSDISIQPIAPQETHYNQKINREKLIDEIVSQPESSPIGSRKIRDLRRQILLESKDKTWANNAELALSDTISSIPYLNDNGQKPTVRCQSTLCEVSGAIQQDAAIHNKSIALERLQNISPEDLRNANLSKPITYAFMSSDIVKGKNTFLLYFDR